MISEFQKELNKNLYTAIDEGRTHDALNLLSENEHMINQVTPLGSWLHIASNKNNLELCKSLVAMGADINAQDNISGCSPIYKASSKGNEDIVSFFIELHAKLDTSEPDRNPLFAAIHRGHLNVVKLLVAAGIDTTVRYTGQTMNNMGAIEFCQEWGRKEIGNYLQSLA